MAEGRWPNQVFDPSWYNENYPDVALKGIEPFEHFLLHGRLEGRRPSAVFDQALYLRFNPDVAKSNIEPFEHFFRHGRIEGRRFAELAAAEFPPRPAQLKPVVDSPHLSALVLAMRDMNASPLESIPQEIVSEAVGILSGFDRGGLEWRSRLLTKQIYRLSNDQGPTPDGLSYAYLELADALNDGRISSGVRCYDDRISLAKADPLGAFEALMQRELGEAIKLQAQLFQSHTAQCSA